MPKKKQDEIKITEVDFSFESDRMIFEVGGKKFSLSKEKAVVLLGHGVERRFTKATAEDFSKIESVRNATIWAWMRKRNFPVREVALEIGVSEEKLLRWVNLHAAVITRFLSQQPEVMRSVEAELEGKYFQPKTEASKEVKFDLKKARKLVVEDKLSFPEAAQKMGFTPQEFAELWQRHLRGLQKKIGG